MAGSASMPAIVAFMDDLMFLSRIRVAAGAQGLTVVSARAVSDLVEASRQGARLVLVDLDARLPAIDAIAAVTTDPALSGVRVVGFFSHVHAERGRQARAAGCVEALPRSAFAERLQGLLRDLRPA
jgi:CheY-like chemotaxis protein